MTNLKNVLAVLGGSGLYDLPGLEHVEEVAVDTPYGPPSDVIVRGRLGETTLLFLPRHGRGHRIPPHAINFRANVCALKKLGATHLLSVSAVGSMKETIAPGDFVVVDQYVDLTKRRVVDLLRRNRGARELRRARLQQSRERARDCGGERAREGRARRPSWGHVRLHRGSSVLDARREPHLPVVGGIGHRDDVDAGGEARPRSGAAVRHARARDRLRLLAPPAKSR